MASAGWFKQFPVCEQATEIDFILDTPGWIR